MDIYKTFDEKIGQLGVVFNNNVCDFTIKTLDNYVQKTNMLINVLQFIDIIKQDKYIANNNLSAWKQLIDERLEKQINENFMQLLKEKPKFSEFKFEYGFTLQMFDLLKKQKRIVLKK